MPQRFRATDAVKRGGGGASPLAARSGWLGLARPLGGFHPIRTLGQAAEAAGDQIDRVDPAAVADALLREIAPEDQDDNRERRLIERRIRPARFPGVKSLDSFDFAAI